MTRLTKTDLVALVEALSERDRQVIASLERFRLMSGEQLERLFWDSPTRGTRARLARHGMRRLEGMGLLTRLERRIGGVRAGSAGSVFTLSAGGQRLAGLLAGAGASTGRTPYEPSGRYVRHTLAVVELYVRFVEAHRGGKLELLGFVAEPECWRAYTSRSGVRQVLKPDALAALGVGAYEDRYFLELDCGTEGRGTLQRKARAYLDYFQSGLEQHQSGVFPKVLWVVCSEKRRDLLVSVCAGLPADAWQLFAVTTLTQVMPLIRAGIGGGA